MPSRLALPLALLLSAACAGKDEPTDTADPFARRCESVSLNLTPTLYALPPQTGAWSSSAGFHALQDWITRSVDGEELRIEWSLLDLVGDDHLDLVITSDEADPALGTQHWKVYEALDGGFLAPPIDYAVPSLEGDWESSRGFYVSAAEDGVRTVDGDNASFSWAIFDLSADGKNDLVVMLDEAAPEVGKSVWRVYEGLAEGFAAEPFDHALPSLSGDWVRSDGFYWYIGSGQRQSWGDGQLSYDWRVNDLNADDVWDLLLVYDQDQVETIGHTQWAMYPGDGRRFGPDPVMLSLPTLAGDEWLTDDYTSAWVQSGQNTRVIGGEEVPYFWSLIDVTRDDFADLVLSWDAADPLVGPSEWRVYPGGPSGFDLAPVAYPVPRLEGDWDASPGFGALGGTNVRDVDGSTLRYRWQSPDLAGEGFSDLVVTQDELDPRLGQEVWRVYAAEEVGFSTLPSYEIPLPTLAGEFLEDPPFFTTKGTAERQVGDERLLYSWSLIDLNDDGLKDLILTYDEADPTIGPLVWHVYEGICHK